MKTKKTALRLLEEIYNRQNFDVCGELMTENAVLISCWGGEVTGRENIRKGIPGIREVFPDLAVDVEDCFGEGDMAAVRFKQSRTHSGDFMGAQGTGKEFSNEELFILLFEGDRIAEVRIFMDMWDRAKQLGFKLVPPEGSE